MDPKLPTEPSDRAGAEWRTVRLVMVQEQYRGRANRRPAVRTGRSPAQQGRQAWDRLRPIGQPLAMCHRQRSSPPPASPLALGVCEEDMDRHERERKKIARLEEDGCSPTSAGRQVGTTESSTNSKPKRDCGMADRPLCRGLETGPGWDGMGWQSMTVRDAACSLAVPQRCEMVVWTSCIRHGPSEPAKTIERRPCTRGFCRVVSLGRLCAASLTTLDSTRQGTA